LGVGSTFVPAGILHPITITFTGASDEFATPWRTPGRYMKSFFFTGSFFTGSFS
jgi:hypothetical protein